MHPAALASAIAGAMPHDSLAVLDRRPHVVLSNDLTPVNDDAHGSTIPAWRISALGFRSMAMQLTDPDRPVFDITGDGGFGFTLQELIRHGDTSFPSSR